MNMKGIKICLVGVALSMMVVGCSHKGSGKHAGQDNRTYSYGAGETDAFDGRNLTAHERQLLSQRKFLFAYDSNVIRSHDYDSLTAHANYLRNNPNKEIRIEGHTDERGSREYNIGLGERRANAVANYLLSNGASPRQIHVVSYGAEKPVVRSSGEEAYSQNRRAEIVYEK